MQRWAGRLLIVVALGHMVLALGSVLPGLRTLAPDGLLGMIGGPWGPPQPERHAAFWSSLGSFAGVQALWGLWVLAAAREGRRPVPGTGLGDGLAAHPGAHQRLLAESGAGTPADGR
ncbi:DUF6463 family protein [Deinococcus multiflagellatus]|uniref:DUF6463 family protein n=1 Tax=Deinococcus multiflagellatus TaxID=1656887 RepID=A0ABW1ZFI9_9DEIO|nr:DUF6463 family protein [Deinococcus multiflagellatus]MBZ9712886.1 DUF6463 family protein [Deinococcus multiflagellatus]